jgi:uncharacterized repeat protein (TIGR03803 family)
MVLKRLSCALTVTLFVVLAQAAAAGSSYRVLHNFGGSADGTIPYGPLLLGKRGSLYGVTIDGGTGECSDYGCGTVFELTPRTNSKWRERVLYSFVSGSDGAGPAGGLIFDGSGNLYGTTNRDGGASPSTAFELSPVSGGWAHTVIYDNSAGPGLVLDKAGNLYGDIGPGDYFGIGAVGELSPGSDGWSYTDLFNFNPTVGYFPPAPPIWDGKGNMFGTTTDGGISQPKCQTSSGCGVIFEMTPNGNGTWAYHILHRFASFPQDGQTPSGGLVMDASGNLYGVTGGLGGAHKNGTVFKFTPSTGGKWKQTVLYDFPNCANGCYPFGTLAFDKAGNLYGASNGGLADCEGYDCGVIFKLTPQKNGAWKYSALHKFKGADGAFPWGVILDEKGNLFGTTENGGKYDAGVAFEITP